MSIFIYIVLPKLSPTLSFARPVAREVAKNLALAGIGALTLVYSQRAEMKGGGHSLASFVKNLNPRVQVGLYVYGWYLILKSLRPLW